MQTPQRDSNAARQAWGEFWADRYSDEIGREPPETTWEGLVWRVGLDYWYDVFSKAAAAGQLLECGCGTARLSRFMAARGFRCTMLDYDVGAVRLSRESFRRKGFHGEYVGGDIGRLPFADGTFDIVYSGGVLQHFRDLGPPITEMSRVLRPGGLFAANVIPDKFSIQTVADWQRTAVRALRRIATGQLRDAFVPVRHLPDFYVNPAGLSDYLNTCRAAGLEVVGRAASPFPNLSLPRIGARAYTRAMRGLMPAWTRFNNSASGLALIWGIGYVIYGTKQRSISR